MAPRLGLEVSPALVMFGELLMLPYGAMQSVIEDELDANPALQRLEPGVCPVCRDAWRGRCPACAGPPGGPLGGSGTAGDADVVSEVAAHDTDTEALRRAVRLETPTEDGHIVDYVVGSLDQHGMLDATCAQLAAAIGVVETRVVRVLEVIQRIGPPGVGARSVNECLLLQLDACDVDADQARLARAVIADHLPALAKGHFVAIAAALDVSRTAIRDVLDLIRRRLRPYPAFAGTAPVARVHVVPDVVVRADDRIPTVELVERALVRLAVRRTDREASAAAHSFLGRLHDRWDTLWRVADYAVRRQRDFLLHGPAALGPLTRAEAAAALNLHESTVSRAVADKYMLLPDRTIVPLSRLFGGGGGIDGELRRLIASEGARMSDQHLAERLRDAGYPVARRTVAKYRARLGFTAASLR